MSANAAQLRGAGWMEGRPRWGRQLARLVVAVGVAALLPSAAGCALLEPVPAYQMDLIGTAWEVDLIGDGYMGDAGLSMAFPDVDVFTVTSACRQLEGVFGYDTDGAAIGFGIPASTSPPCSGVDAEREASLIEALRAVESWRVLSDDRIELRGDTLIVLRRDPAHVGEHETCREIATKSAEAISVSRA